jgi:hypothetical protein
MKPLHDIFPFGPVRLELRWPTFGAQEATMTTLGIIWESISRWLGQRFFPLTKTGLSKNLCACLGRQIRALAGEKQYIAKRDDIRTLLRPHGRRGFSKRTSKNLCALMVASCAPNVGQRSARRTGPNGNMSRRGFILLQNWGVYIILGR